MLVPGFAEFGFALRGRLLNVLSLFDGISCGQIALERAGFKVQKYFASEIKEHAMRVTKYHYPNTIQLGNVLDINCDDLPKIDLLIGGSPCKGISRLNQNQEGLEHDESILFWEYVRIYKKLKKKNPDLCFLLENTHGNKEATEMITQTLKVKPISINSKLLTAQNRPRYYWTNIPNITQPKDLGLTTKTLQTYFKQPTEGQEVPENRVKWLNNESGKQSVKKGYTKVNPYPKYGCITASAHKKRNENYLFRNGKYYFLSQFELEWLQTLPSGYTKMLNYEDAYDVIGDCWTVDVIVHILNFIK